MSQFAWIAACAAAFVALFASLTSLLLHYAKRGEHPLVAPLEAEITTLKVGMIDLVDKLDHFTRRERARRARDPETSNEAIVAPPIVPVGKEQIRAVARSRGLVK